MRERIQIEGTVSDLRLCPQVASIAGETYKSDDTKSYIEFTLLHSLPKVNSNGATFFLPLLYKSIGTAKHQPLNREHQMEGNPEEVFKGRNEIVGSIQKVHLPEVADDSDIPLFPAEPVPAKMVGVLWHRTSEVQQILTQIGEGIEWRMSMEVIRDPSRDVLVAGQNIYRQGDEEWEEAYTAYTNGTAYNGDSVALGIGGTGLEEDDRANFWGGALTLTPADKDTEITSLVAAVATDGGIQIQSQEGQEEDAKISMQSDGTFKGTKLSIEGQEISGIRRVSLWGGDDGEDDYFSLSWSVDERNGDIVKTTEYVFDPETGSISEGGSTMTYEDIRKMIADSEKKFEGWIAPEEVEGKIADATAQYENYLSPEEVEQKIGEAREEWEQEWEARQKALAARHTVFEDAGLEVTPERAEKISGFPIDAEGETAFTSYLNDLKQQVAELKTKLEEQGIEATDDLLAQVAAFDGPDDPRFTQAVAIAATIAKGSGITIGPALVGLNGDDEGVKDNQVSYANVH